MCKFYGACSGKPDGCERCKEDKDYSVADKGRLKMLNSLLIEGILQPRPKDCDSTVYGSPHGVSDDLCEVGVVARQHGDLKGGIVFPVLMKSELTGTVNKRAGSVVRIIGRLVQKEVCVCEEKCEEKCEGKIKALYILAEHVEFKPEGAC